MNLFFNAEARKTNNTLARFTFITSILLFPSLIAGIFGMNNPHFPQISFWWVIGFMALSIIGLYIFFKKKNLL
jgi:Mg2+ and Co2+ transporter CorA